MDLKKEIILKNRIVKLILVNFHSFYYACGHGNLFSLAFKAFFTAVRPRLLSMLVNIETTSRDTSKVPVVFGKVPLVFKSSILLSRKVLSLVNDGNFRTICFIT